MIFHFVPSLPSESDLVISTMPVGRVSRSTSRSSDLADQLGNVSFEDETTTAGDIRLLVDRLVRERVAEELKTVAKKVKTAPVAKFTAKEKADAKKQKDWVKKVEEIIG